MEIKINNITLDVRFRYEPVYLVKDKKNGVRNFRTVKEIADTFVYNRDNPDSINAVLSRFMKSIKTTCTFSEERYHPDVSGKDKYNAVMSCSVVCATLDFPADKNEGRKKAFGKTVIEYCGPDSKQLRQKFWIAYRASHKNEALIIINKIIDYVKKEHGIEWQGDIGCPLCGNLLHVMINGEYIHGLCPSDNCLAWNILPKIKIDRLSDAWVAGHNDGINMRDKRPLGNVVGNERREDRANYESGWDSGQAASGSDVGRNA